MDIRVGDKLLMKKKAPLRSGYVFGTARWYGLQIEMHRLRQRGNGAAR